MKFQCHRCNKLYMIADERVQGRILKIRCKRCAAIITVREEPARLPQAAEVAPKWDADDLMRKDTILQPTKPGLESAGAFDPNASITQADLDAERHDTLMEGAVVKKNIGGELSDAWYVSLDGAEEGPYTLSQAREWVALQDPSDLLYCWRDGFTDWKPTDEVAAFHGLRPSSGAMVRPSQVMHSLEDTDEDDADIQETLDRVRTVSTDLPPPIPARASSSAMAASSPGQTGAVPRTRRSSQVRLSRPLPLMAEQSVDPDGPLPEFALSGFQPGGGDGDIADQSAAEPAEHPLGSSEHLVAAAPGTPLDVVGGPAASAPVDAPAFSNSGDSSYTPSEALSLSPRRRQMVGFTVGAVSLMAVAGIMAAWFLWQQRMANSGAEDASVRRDNAGIGTVVAAAEPTPGQAGNSTGKALAPLTRADILRQSSRSQDSFRRCYEQASQSASWRTIQRLTVDINIDASGVVTDVRFSEAGDNALTQCLARQIRQWKFRSSPTGIRSQLPLVFTYQ